MFFLKIHSPIYKEIVMNCSKNIRRLYVNLSFKRMRIGLGDIRQKFEKLILPTSMRMKHFWVERVVVQQRKNVFKTDTARYKVHSE